MCTPWTLSKLLRCRPCFSQYDSPPGVESETAPSAIAASASNGSMLDRKASGRQMVFRREPINATSTLTENVLPNKNRKYELQWHRGFEDEHYIVLCFGEEESVDMEEDSSEHEALDDSGDDSEGLNTYSPEDDEEDSSIDSTRTESRAKDNERVESSPTGSGYSNQSDGSIGRGSKGSFSFPVLHREWIGSPVQMPSREDLHSRKNSSSQVHLQCCKF